MKSFEVFRNSQWQRPGKEKYMATLPGLWNSLSTQSSSSFAVGDELSVAVAPALNSSQREHLEELTVLASKVGGPKDMVVPVAQMGVLPTLEPTSCSKDYMLCDLKEIHRETVLSVEKIFSPIEGAGENPHGSSCENLEAFCEDETLQLRLKTEVSVSRIWPQFLHIVHLNSSNLLL
jgi:hypothetical protein